MYVFEKAYIMPQTIDITGFAALQVKCTKNFTYKPGLLSSYAHKTTFLQNKLAKTEVGEYNDFVKFTCGGIF